MSELKENVSNTNTWGRALFMILFGIIYSVAVVVIQFLFVLFSSEKNPRLLVFGKEISTFIYQVFLFLTFNTEEKPFPFADWPSDEEGAQRLEATETGDESAPTQSSDNQPKTSE